MAEDDEVHPLFMLDEDLAAAKSPLAKALKQLPKVVLHEAPAPLRVAAGKVTTRRWRTGAGGATSRRPAVPVRARAAAAAAAVAAALPAASASSSSAASFSEVLDLMAGVAAMKLASGGGRKR